MYKYPRYPPLALALFMALGSNMNQTRVDPTAKQWNRGDLVRPRRFPQPQPPCAVFSSASPAVSQSPSSTPLPTTTTLIGHQSTTLHSPHHAKAHGQASHHGPSFGKETVGERRKPSSCCSGRAIACTGAAAHVRMEWNQWRSCWSHVLVTHGSTPSTLFFFFAAYQ
jgi:hypothetical protein